MKSYYSLLIVSTSFVISILFFIPNAIGQSLVEGAPQMVIYDVDLRINSLYNSTYFITESNKIFVNYNSSEMGSELGVIKDGKLEIIDIIDGQVGSNPLYFTVFQNDVYFSAVHGEQGGVIWKTDGTKDGTLVFLDPDTDLSDGRVPKLLTTIDDEIMIFWFNSNLYKYQNGVSEIIDYVEDSVFNISDGDFKFTHYKDGIAYWKSSPNTAYGNQLVYFDGQDLNILYETESVFNGTDVYGIHAIGDKIYSIYKPGSSGISQMYLYSAGENVAVEYDSLDQVNKRYIIGENFMIPLFFETVSIFGSSRNVNQLISYSEDSPNGDIVGMDFASDYTQATTINQLVTPECTLFSFRRIVYSGMFSSGRYEQLYITKGTTNETSLLLDELTASSNILDHNQSFFHASSMMDNDFWNRDPIRIHQINKSTGQIDKLATFDIEGVQGLDGTSPQFIVLLGVVDSKLYYLLAEEYIWDDQGRRHLYTLYSIDVNDNGGGTSTVEALKESDFAIRMHDDGVVVHSESYTQEINLEIITIDGKTLFNQTVRPNLFYAVADVNFHQPLVFKIEADDSVFIDKLFLVD